VRVRWRSRVLRAALAAWESSPQQFAFALEERAQETRDGEDHLA